MQRPLKVVRIPFRRLALFAAISASTLSMVFACGGSNEGAKGPESAGAPAASEAPATNADSTPAQASESTTTLNVPDSGDLQGVKLETSSHKVIEVQGDAGAKPAPHAPEPGRSRQDVQTLVQARRDQARACYDKGLKDHPGIAGKLDIKWTVDPSGNVTEAEVDTQKSDILEPSVGACVVEVIKAIKFNASAKGFETKMHYPFDFHPRGGNAKPATK